MKNEVMQLYKCTYKYSQTCITRSPLGQGKIALYDRWPLKRGSIHLKYSMTGLENGDLFIQMTT
jgi:hypothetical protein